jgi:dihydrodipicolinate synthase/N-acetylneuraminate lyase
MDRNTVDWRGYWPAAVTPFAANGTLDETALTQVLKLYVHQGVHGILVNGTSGEWTSQSPSERRRVAELAVETVNSQVPVVIGCTSFTAAETIGLAKHAQDIGAAGALSTPPPYVHPRDEEIIRFYADLNDATDLPVIAYNWPRGTAVDIGVRTADRIADLDHVVAIKNSTADWSSVLDYMEQLSERVRLFASVINRRGLAAIREFGADGYIDGGGIGAPFAVPFFEAVWAEDWEAARTHADNYWRLTSGWVTADFGGRYGGPQAQVKAAMALLGQPGGTVRPPLLPQGDPERLAQLAEFLRSCGLPIDKEAAPGLDTTWAGAR